MDINILRNNVSLSPSFHVSLSSLCLPSSFLFPPFSTHLFPPFSFFTAIEPWQQQLENNINTPEAGLSKRHQVYRLTIDRNWCRLPDSDCKAPHWIRNRDLSCPPVPWSDAQKPGCCCGSCYCSMPCTRSPFQEEAEAGLSQVSVLLTLLLISNHLLKLLGTEFAQQKPRLVRVQILLVVCTYLKWGRLFHLFVNFPR